MKNTDKHLKKQDITVHDVENFISNVFDFQFRMLVEATFGYFTQAFLAKQSTYIQPYVSYHTNCILNRCI